MKRFIPILLITMLLLSGCSQRPPYKDSRLMMGTFVEVVSLDQRALGIVFSEIERIENLLSFYKDDSEISQLNRQGRLKASPETLFVIKQAGQFWEATEGAFDVTIAPLVQLWGFYDRKYRMPDDLEIERALSLTGFDKVETNGNIIGFKIKGMKIDLSGIAKGYAVDCAVKKLRSAGINSALLNAGGDIYCLGARSSYPWRVAIKEPASLGFADYLELEDKAVATSGSYEQYFSVAGHRYCHIINPKTGLPIDSKIASVSVISDDCLTADALATSVFILGERKGKEIAEKFNSEVRIIEGVRNNQ